VAFGKKGELGGFNDGAVENRGPWGKKEEPGRRRRTTLVVPRKERVGVGAWAYR